ncbi:MAG: response regulator [Acidobacteria bacterium]|nr:response regulator [Acidobacteriota bacterium]
MATILLIDDEPSIRLLYSDVLADQGHDVLEAECGCEALKMFETIYPDLVLLDIKLRSESGLNLLEELIGRYPDLPVILLTAFVSFQDDYLSWLADAYVVKSTDPGELLSEVNRVLHQTKPHAAEAAGQR